MQMPSRGATFNRICGYTMGRDYSRISSHLKWLKIGETQLQIENLDNKQIRVQKVSFEIGPDGKVSVHAGGYEIINSIEGLKDMVKRYRLAYQEMKALEKKLKLQGDF
jgi:hypothetical protein